jgi:hypothetical protein
MKAIVLALLFAAASALHAQVGARADSITVPRAFDKTVLHHCEAVSVDSEGVKVAHDEGVSLVPFQFLPEKWQKTLQQKKDAETEARRVKVEAAERIAEAEAAKEARSALAEESEDGDSFVDTEGTGDASTAAGETLGSTTDPLLKSIHRKATKTENHKVTVIVERVRVPIRRPIYYYGVTYVPAWSGKISTVPVQPDYDN